MKNIKQINYHIKWDKETNTMKVWVNADKKLEILDDDHYNLMCGVLKTALKFVKDQRLIEQDIEELLK